VIGQVKAPAEYPVNPGATFFTYLLQAGGPTDRADLANITLIRPDATTTRARTFNSQNFHDIPPIEPGDTIIVNADVPTQTEKSSRVAASVASILTSLSMMAIAML
jgi:protein involved in polysaccharide export with SLBB domain